LARPFFEVIAPEPTQLQVLEAGQVLVDRGALSGEADAEPEFFGVLADIEAVGGPSSAPGWEGAGWPG
jgi:hypothetical protein